MTPLTALVIALLLAIFYWFLASLPVGAVAKLTVASASAIVVLVLLLQVLGVLHVVAP